MEEPLADATLVVNGRAIQGKGYIRLGTIQDTLGKFGVRVNPELDEATGYFEPEREEEMEELNMLLLTSNFRGETPELVFDGVIRLRDDERRDRVEVHWTGGGGTGIGIRPVRPDGAPEFWF